MIVLRNEDTLETRTLVCGFKSAAKGCFRLPANNKYLDDNNFLEKVKVCRGWQIVEPKKPWKIIYSN